MPNPAKSSTYTLACAAVVGLVCATALTAAHRLLAPYQEANENARNIRHILLALRVSGAETASPQAALDLYAAKVREERHGDVTVYRYVEGETVEALAVPFSGRGYSAPIEGFIGLEPDMTRLRGVTVTYQAETPGLGGQVGSAGFLDRFRGKCIDGLHLVRSHKAAGDTEVDAITGATLTSSRFQVILDRTIPLIQKLRTERAH